MTTPAPHWLAVCETDALEFAGCAQALVTRSSLLSMAMSSLLRPG